MNATQSLISIFAAIDTEKLVEDLTDFYLGCAAFARIIYTMMIVLAQVLLWLYDRGCDLYDRVTLGDPVESTILALTAPTPTSMVTIGLASIKSRKVLPCTAEQSRKVLPCKVEPVPTEVADIADIPKVEETKAKAKVRKPRAQATPKTPKTPTERKPRATKTKV